jgi:general stress protein 26
MENRTDLQDKNAIDKLKELVSEIRIGLFCTNLKTDDGSTCRPMDIQKVCDQGNLWLFSDKDSDKNREIQENKNAQLFFSHPGKSSYLVVNGEAEIIMDQAKVEELWTPLVKAWFTQGKTDPAISIIKVVPTGAYYWDTDGNKMINFIKILASAATGTPSSVGKEGSLTI